LKKIILLLVIIFVLFLICGCSKITDRIDDVKEESTEAGTDEAETAEGIPPGFPGTVPIHDEANVTESEKTTVEGAIYYYVHMEYEGEIGQLSEWYKQELPKNWQIDSESSGDFDDWSEFYVDAHNNEYHLSVYLYQDAGSSNLTVDVNVEEKDRAAEEEGEEVTGEETTEEEAGGPEAAYYGELEGVEIAFVCASVGSAWNIGDHFPGLDIAVYDEYQFDKGNVIRDILAGDKPDIMIIKECAAYFPPEDYGTSMDSYKDLIRDWVNLCRGEEVIPVLATVVPVNTDNPDCSEEQLESILEFNDWVREYCEYEDISVLDLEAALRISGDDRALDPDYDSGDGLHPNDLAYSDELDYILIPALEGAIDIGY